MEEGKGMIMKNTAKMREEEEEEKNKKNREGWVERVRGTVKGEQKDEGDWGGLPVWTFKPDLMSVQPGKCISFAGWHLFSLIPLTGCWFY